MKAEIAWCDGVTPPRRWLRRSAAASLRRPVAAVALMACVACAPTYETGSSPGGANVLTRADLVATNTASLYEAIQLRRPQWLQARGSARIGEPAEVLVFVNDAPAGTVAVLRGWRSVDVVDVRFLTATDAATRYGTTAESGGVLVVRTR